MWDVDAPERAPVVLWGHDSEVTAVILSALPHPIRNPHLTVTHPPYLSPTHSSYIHTKVTAVAWSADDWSTLVSASDDATVRVWRLDRERGASMRRHEQLRRDALMQRHSLPSVLTPQTAMPPAAANPSSTIPSVVPVPFVEPAGDDEDGQSNQPAQPQHQHLHVSTSQPMLSTVGDVSNAVTAAAVTPSAATVRSSNAFAAALRAGTVAADNAAAAATTTTSSPSDVAQDANLQSANHPYPHLRSHEAAALTHTPTMRHCTPSRSCDAASASAGALGAAGAPTSAGASPPVAPSPAGSTAGSAARSAASPSPWVRRARGTLEAWLLAPRPVQPTTPPTAAPPPDPSP